MPVSHSSTITVGDKVCFEFLNWSDYECNECNVDFLQAVFRCFSFVHVKEGTVFLYTIRMLFVLRFLAHRIINYLSHSKDVPYFFHIVRSRLKNAYIEYSMP